MNEKSPEPAEIRDRVRQGLPATLVVVDGEERAGGGSVIRHVEPATGQSLGERTLGSALDVDDAVSSAASAQGPWAALDPGARRDVLFAVAQLMRAERQELAGAVSAEMGMPLPVAAAGVERGADWFAYYAGMADKISGSVPQVSSPGNVLDYAEQVPVGVVGAIIPWNGPIIAAALKVAPALAAGNAVVLKPSELAPLSSVVLARLMLRAGVPAGVLNVVGGDRVAGARLAEHPDVAVVSFTGGNAAGAAVGATVAARHGRAVLELGGKSASLVFPDVDVERVAKLSLTLGAVQNSGQGCFLPTRVLVHTDVHERFVEAVAAAAERVRIGDPFARSTAMGPVASDAARERILGVIADARRDGAGELLTGGVPPADLPDEISGGAFLRPAVFTDVDPESALAQEEVFGPVLSVIPFSNEDEAVRIANGTRYGLAAYVWTQELTRAHRLARRLEAGNLSVNGMSTLHPAAPFSGWKGSGVGVEGGAPGLAEFLRTKNVHVQL